MTVISYVCADMLLTLNKGLKLEHLQAWVWIPLKALDFSLSKKLYPHCLVLVGSRNGYKLDLHDQNCLFHNGTKLNEYKLAMCWFYLSLSVHNPQVEKDK